MSSPIREECSDIDDCAHYWTRSVNDWLVGMDNHAPSSPGHADARPLEDRFLEVLAAIHPTTWGQQ